MLELKFVRQHPDQVKKACEKKQIDFDLEHFLALDKKRRELLTALEKKRAVLNRFSQTRPQEKDRQSARELKKEIKEKESLLTKIEREFSQLLYQLPNPPLEGVPVGQSEKDNQPIRQVGQKPSFRFKPRDYLELARALDLVDLRRAAKVSGSRFAYLKNQAVLLEFALVQLVLETLLPEGFIPLVPPVLLKKEPMRGMGYLDRQAQEVYYLEKDKLYLAGTAEQPIGAMHLNEVFKEKDLPKRYLGFSTCFRREAGSYGRETRGILRVHQFDKLEMFSFVKPADSQREFEYLLSLQEKLLQLLKIPYQAVQICTADLGQVSANKIDLESWLPSRSQYYETHSLSNCTDFQARRLNIRYQPAKSQKPALVHTLNATALAIGRTLAVLIENYQQEDLGIAVPEALKKYLNNLSEIKLSQ